MLAHVRHLLQATDRFPIAHMYLSPSKTLQGLKFVSEDDSKKRVGITLHQSTTL